MIQALWQRGSPDVDPKPDDDKEDTSRQDTGGRPIKAVVGSHRHDEEIFGKAYDPRIVRRIWSFVKPYRARIFISVAAVLVFTLTQLAIPLIIRYAIDHGMTAGQLDRSVLGWAVGAFAATILVNYAASYVQESVVGKVAEDVLSDLRRAMFGHLQRVSLRFMDKTEVGRLMSRLQGDVNSMQEFLETSVMSVGDIVLLFGIVSVLLWLDPRLGLLTLSTMPALFIVRLFWLPRAKVAFMAAHETNSIANGALAEGIHGVRTVQSLERQHVNFELYDEKVLANLRAHLTSAKYAQVMVPIVDTLTGIAMATVIVVGGSMVLSSSLDIGVMVAFLFYIQRFFDPIRSLTMQYSVMQRAMASGQRISEVLDVPVDVKDKPGAVSLSRDTDGSVEFRNVTFGYRPNLPVLKNVSFRVNPGETVALVGPTGSGKSSSMALVHRFYDVWSGQVLVGGHDVRDLTQDSLGDQVAMVLQEPFLFSSTVLENIRYHKTGATREEVVRAATRRRRARLHRAIAGRLRHRARAARRQSVARPAPADQLRPGAGRRRQDPGARRGHGQHRFLHRDADPEGAGEAAGGPHRAGHRPPPGDHPRRRPHHRPAEWRDHRKRQPRAADGASTGSTPASTT